uniref:Glycosyltransferase involved in LPS biosynthesis, GR25 family n=1 Tax=Candidatus Kentrum sp. MB TaxID=2138164 RepID=A0A450XEE6_9GAMM|nr:MAG: Glycosyltransferase involved in LPS biosynthesis, GR25 family [Candidatus Kentron sp. MB]VFK27666.1 MAG: Glycosyltransferase involved in LPS biosynthesis, GR25 family [Candidatus Kentron sp. MB]VFK74382.1 MAG: Glycosyltransferase involved in LPS biosynthesis, GR25 family [Candidatus Kentron sp. MB]
MTLISRQYHGADGDKYMTATTWQKPNALPILVINLERSVERREWMQRHLSELGLDCRIVDAIDGLEEDLQRSEYYNDRKIVRTRGRRLLSTEIGCVLSHKKCYELMMAEHIPEALILEDDVVLSEEFPSLVEEILNSDIPYELLRFVCSVKALTGKMREVAQIDSCRIGRMRSNPYGAYAYLIKNIGARKMFKALSDIYLPIDFLMNRPWEMGIDDLICGTKSVWITEEQDLSTIRAGITYQPEVNKPWYFPVTKVADKLVIMFRKNLLYFYRAYRDRKTAIDKKTDEKR